MRRRNYFNNIRDKQQYLSIVHAIKDGIANNNDYHNMLIPQDIYQEIGEYSTGLILPCRVGNCDGVIHYLREDNFKPEWEYGNNYHLDSYQCDSQIYPCTGDRVYIIECKSCDSIEQIPINMSNNKYVIRKYNKNNMFVVCEFVTCCGSIYCLKDFKQNGMFCELCGKYICKQCFECFDEEEDEGQRCINDSCLIYCCGECCDEKELLYCVECGDKLVFSS